MVGNTRDGLLARGSWWGINRIEGIWLTSIASFCPSILDPTPPALRTFSAGAALSALFLVMLGREDVEALPLN